MRESRWTRRAGPYAIMQNAMNRKAETSDAGVKTRVRDERVRHKQSNLGQDQGDGSGSGGWRRKDKVGNWPDWSQCKPPRSAANNQEGFRGRQTVRSATASA